VGIQRAKGDVVILLNNDTVLLSQNKNDWIRLLCDPLKDDVGITAPLKLFNPKIERDFAVFFCVAIRKEMFDKCGLLDETFSPGAGEDTDFCIKVEQAGYRVIQVPTPAIKAEPGFMVGNFPIYHKGEGTMLDDEHAEEWKKVVQRNEIVLQERYGVKLDRARQCEGWVSEPELRWLGWTAKTHKVIIEVGSWHGRSTRALGDNTTGLVYAVDHFNGSAGESMHVTAKQDGGDHAFMEFCKNNMDLMQQGKIIALRGTSANMARILKEKGVKADMIFIDAGHTYEEVKEDIDCWRDLLTDDGVFCGHDALTWAGVTQAIQEKFHQCGVVNGTSIWFCGKKDIR
jgi:hypothetical protein